MTDYDFTLSYAIPPELDPQGLEDALFEAGCDDALPGLGQPGRLALAFTRSGASAADAVASALDDARRAVPQARLVEVGPDRVGLSDIAELLQFSRQNMRKLAQTHPDTFPLPLHEGNPSLWHLADVLDWFCTVRERTVDPGLYAVAMAAREFNLRHELQRLPSGGFDVLRAVAEATP